LPSVERAIAFLLRSVEEAEGRTNRSVSGACEHCCRRRRARRFDKTPHGFGGGLAPWPSLPRFVLRSEPAAGRFKGKSQAIGDRRLVMGGRVLRRPEGPLVRNPPMLALAAAAP
jgi:hypothetical protein